MDGATLAAGAVAGVMRAKKPVQLARAVMEKSPHVLFSGPAPRRSAANWAWPEVTPDYFITEERFINSECAREKSYRARPRCAFGTVGAVARERPRKSGGGDEYRRTYK